jgi:hypothetical protein
MPVLYFVAALLVWGSAFAQVPSDECFLDRYTQAQAPDRAFLNELSALKMTDPTPASRYVPAPVFNMDLSKSDQAFAVKFVKYTTFAEGYDQCTTLECLFEKTYQKLQPKDSSWSPVLSYWYYKMGYGVSTLEEDSLFKTEELRGMWAISNFLPSFYQRLSTLNLIRRIPDGYVGDDGSVGTYYNTSKQLVVTNLSTVIQNHRLSGTFHHTLVHEMSHAFDRSVNASLPNAWFSETPEWLNLSQWKRLSRSDWQVIDGNFSSTYAATSPGEDFAESMAYFILEPDTLKKNAPEKFEFISKKFFGGRKFDTESLKASYLAILQTVAPTGETAVREKLAEIKRTDYYACGALSKDAEAELIQKALTR